MARKMCRPILLVSLILWFSCSGPRDERVTQEPESPPSADTIHERVLTLDAHIDIEVSFFTPEKPDAIGHQKLASLEAMQSGGLDAAFFAVYVEQGPLTAEGFRDAHDLALEKIETIHRVAEEEIPDEIQLAFHPGDVESIYEQGKITTIIGMENGYPLGEDIGNVRKFYDLGVRYITLSHIGHNQICDSNLALNEVDPTHGGLSSFGEEVVSEMNRLGMIIDVSHIAKSSVLDVLRLSEAPVMASHSTHRDFCGIDRMWDDEQLIALRENGGVFHLVGLATTIKAEPQEKTDLIEALRRQLGFPTEYWPFFLALEDAPADIRSAYNERLSKIEAQYPSADVKDFVDRIDSLVERIGIDHVGISSDFYDRSWSLRGWTDAGETASITRELVERGYTEEQIAKIWSGNTLRVWSEVERVAADLNR